MENITIEKKSIEYSSPFEFYKKFSGANGVPSFLLESRTSNLAYARQSIVVPNAAVKITGKNDRFSLQALSKTGEAIIDSFSPVDFNYACDVEFTRGRIEGRIDYTAQDESILDDVGIVATYESELDEAVRTCETAARKVMKDTLDKMPRDRPSVCNLDVAESLRQPNASYVIRTVMDKFSGIDDEHFGLYGGLAYDFARNYIDIGNRFADDEGEDFSLFLPSTVVSFDDIKERAEVKSLFFNGMNDGLEENVGDSKFIPMPHREYEDMSIADYEAKVGVLVGQIRSGRMMQCVLSRNRGFSLEIPPIESYGKLRDINPSPYSFFFSLGENEFLYGASPEVHIKVVNGEIEIRPIAGTTRRSSNPLEDARARIGLQIDQKELREHSMLVDLATSELCRLSKPGSVRITDLYTVEEYPNLYHLVSGVRGSLRNGVDALDALLTTIPAGTLSGAPKVEAMKVINQMEASRRNYYGGAVGFLGFNGGCNTGITIRSVHVKDGMSYVRSGAGIVADSIPEYEAREIGLKSEKAVGVLRK